MADPATLPRSVLPVPDQPYTGPVTYDAKDPDSAFPPIRPLRAPAGAGLRYDPAASRFTGRIQWVQIDLGKDAADADHLITADERLRVAMYRQ